MSAFPEDWVRKYYWPCSNAMLFTSYLNVASPVAVGDFQVEKGSECVIPEPGHRWVLALAMLASRRMTITTNYHAGWEWLGLDARTWYN